MGDDEIIEKLELENKVLNESNKALKDKIDEQQKEIDKEKEKREIAEENHKVLSLDLERALKELGLYEDTIISDELVLEINKKYISKDKIKDYFAYDLAFKRKLIREKEKISNYNRGKFDTIEDLFERLEDNKWN